MKALALFLLLAGCSSIQTYQASVNDQGRIYQVTNARGALVEVKEKDGTVITSDDRTQPGALHDLLELWGAHEVNKP